MNAEVLDMKENNSNEIEQQLIQAKAHAYDRLFIFEQAQKQLEVANAEIRRLSQLYMAAKQKVAEEKPAKPKRGK